MRNKISKLKKYQFLFEELVKRDFKKKYKRTVLGMAWSVLSPLLTLLVMMLVSMCAAAAADELTEPLNQAVPFGIAHIDDGSGIKVYRSVSARNSWDTLTDYQICAILSTQVSGGKDA